MNDKQQSLGVRMGRVCYFLLTILFTVCVVVQVLLAGAATFVDPANWWRHSMFVHLFGFYMPILMFALAFLGKMPRWAYWQCAGLLGLIFAMYFTANITSALPWVAAMHPVVGFLLLLLSVVMVAKTWRFALKGEVK